MWFYHCHPNGQSVFFAQYGDGNDPGTSLGIPDESDKMKEEMVKMKRQRAVDRRMVSGLAVSLVESIPGQAEATRVMENVLESMMTSVNRNMVWSILESRKDIQEWVTLRIKQQGWEEEKEDVRYS